MMSDELVRALKPKAAKSASGWANQKVCTLKDRDDTDDEEEKQVTSLVSVILFSLTNTAIREAVVIMSFKTYILTRITCLELGILDVIMEFYWKF